MKILEPPINRHILGKMPTHSKSAPLASNFKDLEQTALRFILTKAAYLSSEGRPTQEAVKAGLLDKCEKLFLWNLDELEKELRRLGVTTSRQFANQELPPIESSEPVWVNLSTLGSYFNASGATVGKWISELKLKDRDGMASEPTIERGLATVVEMSAGGNKTRKINQWNLRPMQRLLMKAGHPLDFDYEKSLKGKSKNSDVAVTSIDSRVDEFVDEFVKLLKDPAMKTQLQSLVKRTPKIILKRAEAKLQKPGFITEGRYLRVGK